MPIFMRVVVLVLGLGLTKFELDAVSGARGDMTLDGDVSAYLMEHPFLTSLFHEANSCCWIFIF